MTGSLITRNSKNMKATSIIAELYQRDQQLSKDRKMDTLETPYDIFSNNYSKMKTTPMQTQAIIDKHTQCQS